jgi:hypothetical protein
MCCFNAYIYDFLILELEWVGGVRAEQAFIFLQMLAFWWTQAFRHLNLNSALGRKFTWKP